jgi:hypothetical protein
MSGAIVAALLGSFIGIVLGIIILFVFHNQIDAFATKIAQFLIRRK